MGSYRHHNLEALRFLNKIRPKDGWALDSNNDGTQVRLLRRNVPLTDEGFLFLFHDVRAQYVVGVTNVQKEIIGRGVVLVEPDGTICRGNLREVRVTIPKSTTSATERTTSSSYNETTTTTTTTTTTLSDEANKQLLQYAALIIGTIMVVKVLFSAMFILYVVAFPLVYLYAVQNCPSNESFDAKKELKRVLRGHHLPEDHPDKPKGFLRQVVARAEASVATELATSMGYEVFMMSLLGAATIATVRVPVSGIDCYWVGMFGKWQYVMQREIPKDNTKKD